MRNKKAFIFLLIFFVSCTPKPPGSEDVKRVLEKHYTESSVQYSNAIRKVDHLEILSMRRVSDEKGVFSVLVAAKGIAHYLPGQDSASQKPDTPFTDTVSMNVIKGPIGWVWRSYDK
jgi:hypothetical protein